MLTPQVILAFQVFINFFMLGVMFLGGKGLPNQKSKFYTKSTYYHSMSSPWLDLQSKLRELPLSIKPQKRTLEPLWVGHTDGTSNFRSLNLYGWNSTTSFSSSTSLSFIISKTGIILYHLLCWDAGKAKWGNIWKALSIIFGAQEASKKEIGIIN